VTFNYDSNLNEEIIIIKNKLDVEIEIEVNMKILFYKNASKFPFLIINFLHEQLIHQIGESIVTIEYSMDKIQSKLIY